MKPAITNENMAAYFRTEKGKACIAVCGSAEKKAQREGSRKHRAAYPEKIKAHNAVNNAIRAGKLKPSIFCEECGLPAKTEAHHPDYSRLLEVKWLCRECHIQLHKN